MSPFLVRHGDLLVSRVEQIPPGAAKRPHLVLAEGELTGHSHRIAEPQSAKLFQFQNDLYLEVVAAEATLIHQEHGPIPLPQGFYKAWRQREYSPREIRTVRD